MNQDVGGIDRIFCIVVGFGLSTCAIKTNPETPAE
jgi:hypothetical protein